MSSSSGCLVHRKLGTNQKKRTPLIRGISLNVASPTSSPRVGNPHLKGKKILRICMLGSTSVGKTSIVRRILGQSFTSQYVPTVYESFMKHVKIKEDDVLLDVQDMPGSSDFPAMEKCAVENANIIIIVFALDNFESCQHAVNLSISFEKKNTRTPIILVGNKSDICNGTSQNKNEINDFITNVLQRNYVEMSAKYDRYANRLLNEIFEAYEISCGPYRVKVAKEGLAKKFVFRSPSLTAIMGVLHGGI